MDLEEQYAAAGRREPPDSFLLTAYNVIDPSFSPAGTSVAVLVALADGRVWKNLPPAEYPALKERYAEALVERAARFYPRLPASIEVVSVSTPITNMRYTGNIAGAIFYPPDFTFVCPSKLLAFDEALDRFHEKGAEVVGVSVDSHYTHLAWKNTRLEDGGVGSIRFPLVSDLSKSIAQSYGILHQGEVALRALFLLGRAGIIRHATVNDLPLGRSVPEALRMLEALKLHEQKGHLCPANWQPGQPGMEPSRGGAINPLSQFAKKR